MLLALQIVHTLIAVISVVLAGHLVSRAIKGGGGRGVFIAAIWLLGIFASLIAVGFECTLQLLARRIEGVDHQVQDLLTPSWFNDLIVPVTTPVVFTALTVILVRRLIDRRKGRGRLQHARSEKRAG